MLGAVGGSMGCGKVSVPGRACKGSSDLLRTGCVLTRTPRAGWRWRMTCG